MKYKRFLEAKIKRSTQSIKSPGCEGCLFYKLKSSKYNIGCMKPYLLSDCVIYTREYISYYKYKLNCSFKKIKII